ncbi:preprotein translocase subunit SecA [bacterium]|nr:preprotein translocase subunit SecA [bacterium]
MVENPLLHLANAIGRGVTAVFGSRNDRLVRELLPLVEEINALEPSLEKLSDAALAEKTEDLKKTLKKALVDRGAMKLLDDARDLRQNARSQEAVELDKQYRVIEQACLDEILPPAFALVREAGKRTIGQRHYDVQLLGGIVLHQGKISEMITGEGKTLVSTLPAFLNSLPGYGVHIVTVNDYLARRDRDWNAQLFNVLGVSVGVIQSDMGNAERKRAYSCDITYGTNNEYGFDYLRDNMKVDGDSQVQRRLNYAIIDEVDSILVDEARTPLIISGDAMDSSDNYYIADAIARKLRGTEKNKLEEEARKRGLEKEDLEVDWDYVFSEKDHQVIFTERGIERTEKLLGKGSIYDGANIQWPHFIEQALRAHCLYEKDVEYVVDMEDDRMSVIIVDEFTGRKMHGRQWSDGLHQAVEAKEGLKIKEETQTLATITLQNYFRLYRKLAGMTGTASTEAAELWKIYQLDVVSIPTNRPLIRRNFQDVVYRTVKEKFKAVCAEIEAVHAMGRPILVGTISIENSERLSEMLSRRGIEHDVLNAKQHEREAQIVARAGQLGRVTIATNMAGRGTDIILGPFTYQELLDHWKRAGAAPKDLELPPGVADGRGDAAGLPEFYEKLAQFWRTRKLSTGATLISDDPNSPGEWQWRDVAFEFAIGKKDYEGVKLCTRVQDLGGLHIIGTERHEARRIDNQLRGRCGRQGDPGSSRFYLSLEDDLMRIFASDRVSWILSKLGMEEGQEISAGMVTRAIEKAQKKVETHHFDIRKNLLEYDGVMDEQRKLVYSERQRILDGVAKIGDPSNDFLAKTGELSVAGDSKENTSEGVLWWKLTRSAFDHLTVRWALGGAPQDATGVLDLGWRTLRSAVFRWIDVTLDKAVKQYVSDDVSSSEHDIPALCEWVRMKFDFRVLPRELDEKKEDEIYELLMGRIKAAYAEREKAIGEGDMRRLERFLLLQKIDEKWKDHLHGMDQLRSGIGFRGYAQQDPKVAYKKEGYELFEEMWGNIGDEISDLLFRIKPMKEEKVEELSVPVMKPTAMSAPAEFEQTFRQQAAENERQAYAASNQGPDAPAAKPVIREQPKIGRNEKCHCGSGKKYKNCHGKEPANK